MIWYALTGRPRPKHSVTQQILAALIAVIFIAPFAWWITDRTPPQIRLEGRLEPSMVARGGSVHVVYKITPRLRDECPGTIQQEIVDSQNTIFSKLAKAVSPTFAPDPDKAGSELLIGNPVIIPAQAAPGPATFRTVSFRYCNWMHYWLHWPIVQIGPDIHFTITDEVTPPKQ